MLVLAIVIATAPAVHHHGGVRRGPEASVSAALFLPCAVCATVKARVIIDQPRVVEPIPVVEEIVHLYLLIDSQTQVTPLASRAPPA